MRRRILGLSAAALCVGVIAAYGAAGPVFAAGNATGRATGRALSVHEPNPAALSAWKARAAALAGQHAHAATAGPLVPSIDLQWDGINDTRVTPPDPNGAIGSMRYMEIINLKFAIYDRTGSLINSGGLGQLTGTPDTQLSDPMVIWDTHDQKFYYTVLDVGIFGGNNSIRWGVSKTDSPSGPSDFCNYDATFGYGTTLPDYPKLGNSPSYLLIGVNDFANAQTYTGSDVDFIFKGNIGPNPITTCPAQGLHGRIANIKDADGTQAFTPVPGIMTDTQFPSLTRAFVVATPVNVANGGSATHFDLYGVNDLLSGAGLTAARSIPVASYRAPANAPQCSSPRTLDTIDGRFEHAVVGADSMHSSFSIWTSHAVFGGAGSEERWYEVNTLSGAVVQSGVATDPSLYVWNGAISPDRRVGPDGSAFGSDMVMEFNTANATHCSAIQMVSKVGNNAQSGFVMVKQSTGPDADFSCGGGTCRWGDYSGATPDPIADMTQPVGRVWMTNMYNAPSSFTLTENWEATP